MTSNFATQLNVSSRKVVCAIAGLGLALTACQPQTTTAPPAAGDMNATPAASAPAAGGTTLSLSGAGASAPDPLYQRWFADYNKKDPNVQISYQSVGSGAGIKQFVAGTVDFGASDAVLKPEDTAAFPAARGKALQLPTTGVFIVFAYNLKGVDTLKLSRESFCGIADGTITKWNDAKLVKDNAGVTLPDTAIAFVRRSDGSGTTSIFTQHIEKACPNWKAGSGKTVEWPVGSGAKGNEGVSAQIQQTEGSIGYTEFSFAKASNLKTAIVQNKAGEFIAPTPEAAAKALEGVTVPDNFAVSVPDPEAKDAYPIVSLTWVLVDTQPRDAAKGAALKNVLKWALVDGKAAATELGYLPLPDAIVTKVNAAIDAK